MPRKVGGLQRGRREAVDPRHYRASHGDRYSQQSRLCLLGGQRARAGKSDAYSEAGEREKAKGNLKEAEGTFEMAKVSLAMAGQYLDKAEWHLNQAVEFKPISPRPRNNLGRVLLKRSQQFDADARAAEAKGNAAEAARLKALAKTKRDAAI